MFNRRRRRLRGMNRVRLRGTYWTNHCVFTPPQSHRQFSPPFESLFRHQRPNSPPAALLASPNAQAVLPMSPPASPLPRRIPCTEALHTASAAAKANETIPPGTTSETRPHPKSGYTPLAGPRAPPSSISRSRPASSTRSPSYPVERRPRQSSLHLATRQHPSPFASSSQTVPPPPARAGHPSTANPASRRFAFSLGHGPST